MPARRSNRHRKPSVTLAEVQRDHSQFESDFDMVYDQLKDTLAAGTLFTSENAQNLVPLIMACIRLVERVSTDKGAGKKALVMALITRLIADSQMSEEQKIVVQVLLESLGPSIIDGLIEADHGKMLAHGLQKLREKCGCVGA